MSLFLRRILFKVWRELPFSYPLRFKIQQFFIQQFSVGVAGVIFNRENQVLLLRHSYRKEYPWGLPSGWLKRGEQPSEALVREIEEETGLKVRVEEPLIIATDEKWPRLDVVYLGKVKEGIFRPSIEVKEGKFFEVGSLPVLLPSQEKIIEKAHTQRRGIGQ